jgi:hypothetical protein
VIATFGSSAHQASDDPELDAARTSAYEILRAAVHSVHVSEPRHAPDEPIESLRSWALVHGLATMINEGTIAPRNYGASSARELTAALLNSPQAEKRGQGGHERPGRTKNSR